MATPALRASSGVVSLLLDFDELGDRPRRTMITWIQTAPPWSESPCQTMHGGRQYWPGSVPAPFGRRALGVAADVQIEVDAAVPFVKRR